MTSRADSDRAYCGWCDHHADSHDYRRGDALNVPCAECPDGTCRRKPANGATSA